MKIKLLCILLSLLSSWAYAKPTFEDIRVFEVPHAGAILVINGNEKAIASTPIGVFETSFLRQPFPRRIFFGNEKEDFFVEETSWNKTKQGYYGLFADRRVLFKPLDVYPMNSISNVKLLHNSRRFRVYAKNASGVVYNTETLDVVEPKGKISVDKSFKDGTMIFTIVNENSGKVYGNAGSSPVEFYRDKNCLIFTESTGLGGKQVFIISDKYNTREKGFWFTYVRNTMMFYQLMRSTYRGIAKVDY